MYSRHSEKSYFHPALFHSSLIFSLPFPFPSDPLWEEAELWGTQKGAGEWESCKESLGSCTGRLAESQRREESKGPPQKSLEACVSLFAGWLMVLRLFQVIVNWPFSLQSTFTYLIAFDLHNNCRAVIIFLILQMSQMKLIVVMKWAHEANQRQNLNLEPRDLFPPLVQFHYFHPVSWK